MSQTLEQLLDMIGTETSDGVVQWTVPAVLMAVREHLTAADEPSEVERHLIDATAAALIWGAAYLIALARLYWTTRRRAT